MTTTYANPFHMFYLANCGILVEAGGHRILIDGLMDGQDSFDDIPPTALKLLMEGCEPYGSIDLLLFTHAHLDHLDLEKTEEFLLRHRKTRVLLPSGAASQLTEVPKSQITAVSGSGFTFSPYPGEPLQIDFVLTDHISFHCPEHYCIRLRWGSDALLFTADMDFLQLPFLADRLNVLNRERETESSPPCREGQATLTVFCNPILLGKEKWAREVSHLQPDHVFIYHIPSESLDQFGYRKMALRRKDRCETILPNLTLLLSPMTRL